jgi:putative methyltransferase (TIGR04325 family)
LVRRAVPAALRGWWNQRRATQWTGDYADWAAAVTASGGYAAPHILARVASAVRAVRSGEGLFERDGVLFQEAPPAWPVLDELLALADLQGGELTVLDFGGGLGGSYFNYRHAWAGIPRLRWHVVEQPAFVAAGRAEFADGRLQFFESAEMALAAGRPDVLLLASVLPYVPAPYELLRTLLAVPYRYVLVERTGVVTRANDSLTVQYVPPRLGGGSYPCWLFSRERLLARFGAYQLRRDERAFEGGTAGVDFRSFWFERREDA